ncbi:MAG: FAD-dependent oxidoreductase [Candidatus Uhrbacteria bacterium]|nr:FAD-dependent oxidoreductase [Candidatus Uhrbacteria bacterium]
MHYVIIGGGIAGTTCAEELRKLDSASKITLISEEFHALYSRVLLPHYIKGKIPRERVFLKKESWYAEQQIEWLAGEIIERVDAKNKHIEFVGGGELSYDKLLIASGSEVKLMDQDLPGVSYLRTLDDADQLVELMRALPKDAHACIYGGGFIACEYLNIFHEANIPITLAYRGAHMWSRGISEEAGMLIKNQLVQNGITVIENAKEIECIGEKTIESIFINGQTYPCSLLGVGVGVAPHFSLLQESGIQMHEGILTNAFLETNVKDVYAAGDVAEFFDERFERTFITGNWMNAQMQGRVAARNMTGSHAAFDLVSSYAMNIVGIEIIFIGDTSRTHADETRLIGTVEAGGVTELFVRKNKLVGAILTGRNMDRAILTKLIQEKADLTDSGVVLPM